MPSPENKRPALVAQQHRRDIQQQFVDQAVAQERAAQGGAGLDLDFVDVALRQLRQGGVQVESVAVARHREWH